MTPDAIRSFVQRYLSEHYGERTVMLLTSRVAQKSYGTEKRFLCPPPTTVLSGSWCIQLPSTSSSSNTASNSSTSMQPRLTIQISGESNQQSGTLEWSTPPPPVLPSAFISSEGFLHSSSTIGKCVSKQLHINDADEKRKRVQVLVNIQLANNENIGTFGSKGIKVISKPSKKRQSLKNIDLCIHHGTTISLFNRIRSQTVSTKYLGVSSQQSTSSSSSSSSSSSPSASTNNNTAASNCCFVARTNVWDPFVIWIVDPQRTQQSASPLDNNNNNNNGANAHHPPPPAMALHHTGKEQLAVHYNQPIVLQCLSTGLVSPVMSIRKVDKGSLALSGIMVMEPTLSSTTEALGDPVSQLHKVAFEIKSPPSPVSATNVSPSSSSPSHLYQQQHRNIFLACLNDVVGRHKCHNPPRRVASQLSSSTTAAAALRQQQQQQQQQQDKPALSSGRRRSSTAPSSSSALDQNDPLQGAVFEQDVSDAAVWTIVGTDCARFTFAVPTPTSTPTPSSPQDTFYMRPDIAPFPVVSSVSQGDTTLCLWGESFTTHLTVYVGDLALSTEFKSPEALVCVIPSTLLSSSSSSSPGAMASKKQPILLVRNDGVIYKTNHSWNK
ncbi:beta-trefoil DNA-binding domain-containing protein [Absidia repens]|uniref:Beta-trefoil DNA-binding domain-containing protein n=1 Tax=Absidia repens TaxID=90262 RepID=A0A1X2J212_9FUNG|nr:beta-trefoil DNA-binding domain-containing protein [Absidia repens]